LGENVIVFLLSLDKNVKHFIIVKLSGEFYLTASNNKYYLDVQNLVNMYNGGLNGQQLMR